MRPSLKQVCIQGLGFVGAAMAVAVAMARAPSGGPIYSVIGIDLDTPEGNKRVNAINNGTFPFSVDDPELAGTLKKCVEEGSLSATTNPSCFATADIVVVDIPLDLPFRQRQVEFKFDEFVNGLKTVFQLIKPGALVIIETTIPPGTCEKIIKPALKKELRDRGLGEDTVYLAHSFERVMPGPQYLDSVIDYWRVYAGDNEFAADKCEEFLSNVINTSEFPLTRLSSLTASESTKVLENTYRSVNIAFIEEWTGYAEAIGIDLFEVLDAIRMRPTHANIRFPGIGVGGYCLTKDPLFAPAAAKQMFGLPDATFPFAELSTEVNQQMPIRCANNLKDLMGGSLAGTKLLILGVAYRSDVGDTRYSPVETYVRKVEDEGAMTCFVDPYVEYWDEMGRPSLSELPEPSSIDAVIFCVAHRQFKKFNLSKWMGAYRPYIQDLACVLTEVERRQLRVLGCSVESVGRGQGL